MIPDWEGLPTGFNPDAGLKALSAELISEDPTRRLIAEAGVRLTCLLLNKNARYGNSALAPMSVFARDVTPQQRMAIRMDDKINRIVRGQGINGGDGEDPRVDLAGYLLLDIISTWQGDGDANTGDR